MEPSWVADIMEQPLLDRDSRFSMALALALAELRGDQFTRVILKSEYVPEAIAELLGKDARILQTLSLTFVRRAKIE